MSDQQWGPNPPQQPQQPPTSEPPPAPNRTPLPGLIGGTGIGLAILLALVLVGSLISQSRTKTATPTPTTAAPATSPAEETFPDEGITQTTAPEVATGKVGETVTLTDTSSGQDVARVVIDRVKFAGGDEFNKPERGLWLGVHVKTKALADGQTSLWGDLYVVMRGHHYDGDGCCPDGFSPTLDYVDLNAGETAEGWLVFDVPARHGQVVLKNSLDDSKIATWTF